MDAAGKENEGQEASQQASPKINESEAVADKETKDDASKANPEEEFKKNSDNIDSDEASSSEEDPSEKEEGDKSKDSPVKVPQPLEPIREEDDDGKEKKEIKKEEKPAVIGAAQKVCAWCKKVDVDMFKCSRCRSVNYCEVNCQRADWPTHKLICKKVEDNPKDTSSLASKTEREGFERFRDIKKIGQGNFSDIFSGVEISTNKIYAIKRINKMRLKHVRKEDDIMMERHCLNKLSGNPYVIEMYECFQDSLNLYVKMEFVNNGELWNLIKNFGLQSLSLVKYFMSHTLQALKYIHSKGIVHRDLKPENIMLTKENKIKLIDFGTARDLLEPTIKGSGNSAKGKRVFDHFVGTPNFMAPECIRNRDSNYKSDIWSFACLSAQLLTGFPAYMGGSEYLIFEKALNKLPVLPDYLFSKEFKDLICSILKVNFEERPSLEDIMKHPFFEGWDHNNIPSFDFCAQDMTVIEKHIASLKEEILSAKSKGIYYTKYHKKELSEKFGEFLGKVDELPFSASEKEIVTERIKYLERQFRQFFEMESFSWGDD